MLGNFGAVDYGANALILVLLVLFTLLINVVLLNMLISIIGERSTKELKPSAPPTLPMLISL